MEYVFLGIIVFIFVLAVFDLFVGVSNDAVNFLNSAVGARAARFRTIVLIAALGVFFGAMASNGMMDIARHGIFRPENYAFFDIICICMAVMVTDIILLDVFNTLGMPTSTTVSMVFELLGASFVVALFKLSDDTTGLGLVDMLNTEKALSVIIGIFLSVAIAFVFGTVVQYLSRLWFSFNYKKGLWWKIGLFGGLSITAIIYFLIIKGAKDLTFMTPQVKAWVAANTALLMTGCFVGFTLLCQLLYWLKVNVFKVVVLTGTFALAMAFAGNDLVNFIGVPLTGFASFQDYMAGGGGDPEAFMMGSLNGPASTPIFFLLASGLIMVIALSTSKKARKVVNTSVNLSRQDAGDEMFGSSRIARRLVRWSISIIEWVVAHTPDRIRAWTAKRLNANEAIMEDGAAFDLVRGSINLVLSGALIAFGTSLKLPLSTTYVTFMVAMGTSLADGAWGRDSAVFRITGVISVIGGWFITAGVAFIGAALIATIMHLGSTIAIVITTIVALAILIHSNLKHKKDVDKGDNALFRTIVNCDDQAKTWELLKVYMAENRQAFLTEAATYQRSIVDAFFNDNGKTLGKAVSELARQKEVLKSNRRKATLCFRRITPDTAMEKSAWFYLASNSQMSMLYNLRRIAEVCHEHVDNNFRPLSPCMVKRAEPLCANVGALIDDAEVALDSLDMHRVLALRSRCNEVKNDISAECRRIHNDIRQQEAVNISVLYVYLNMMQEQQELISALRKLLRADIKLMSDVTPSLTVLEH